MLHHLNTYDILIILIYHTFITWELFIFLSCYATSFLDDGRSCFKSLIFSLLYIAEPTRDGREVHAKSSHLKNLAFRCSGPGVGFIHDEQKVHVQTVRVRDSWAQAVLNMPAHVLRTVRLLKVKPGYFLCTGPTVTSSVTVTFKFIHFIQCCFKSFTHYYVANWWSLSNIPFTLYLWYLKLFLPKITEEYYLECQNIYNQNHSNTFKMYYNCFILNSLWKNAGHKYIPIRRLYYSHYRVL